MRGPDPSRRKKGLVTLNGMLFLQRLVVLMHVTCARETTASSASEYVRNEATMHVPVLSYVLYGLV